MHHGKEGLEWRQPKLAVAAFLLCGLSLGEEI